MRTWGSEVIIKGLCLIAILIIIGNCAALKETSEGEDADIGNGAFDGDCGICHGSAINPAPPIDLSGNQDSSAPGVGAHQSHLTDGPLRVAIACSECHIVPTNVDDPGHLDSDPPAELTFGILAETDGSSPSWNGSSCTGSYCHGATLSGGSNTTPTWTVVDGSEVVCGSCHGLPPVSPHTNQTDCVSCHSAVVDAGQNIIDTSLHINGVVNFDSGGNAGGGGGNQACNLCHGSTANDAPPVDTNGNSATSFPGVGAHQSHLNDGDVSIAIACGECHILPNAVDDAGHNDSALPAEITFGTLAETDGASPSWNGSSCTDSYCHGSTLSGGTNTSPTWTVVNGTETACGTCHGLPPTSGHPNNTKCVNCHSNVVDAGQNIINTTLHINGTVDRN